MNLGNMCGISGSGWIRTANHGLKRLSAPPELEAVMAEMLVHKVDRVIETGLL
jgi:hypothetical protein